ncbi:MAG: hypothetical protein ACI841_004068 [Planctomycetota bacterium]|jgi:hypothetical protein
MRNHSPITTPQPRNGTQPGAKGARWASSLGEGSKCARFAVMTCLVLVTSATVANAALGSIAPNTSSALPSARAPRSALHDGPPIYLEIGIAPDMLSLRLQGEQATIHPWLGMSVEKLIEEAPLPESEMPLYRKAFEDFLSTNNELQIDGVTVAPQIQSIELTEAFGGGYGAPIFTVKMEYPCDGWPREVRIIWERFDGVQDIEGQRVPGIFRWDPGNDPDFIFATLTPEEPEFIWHATADIARKRVVRAVTGEIQASEELPLGSVVLIALLVLSIPFTRKWKAPMPLMLGLWMAGLGGAYFLRDHRSAAPWQSKVSMPSRDQAISMFETLHSNVYRAFSAGSEDAIYDLLAKSVAPELLDDLYAEVYESLILRGEGGAVCDVQKVQVLEREVIFPAPEEQTEDSAAYDVNWNWQVEGLVTHWGHQHSRTNEYRARYRVAHDGASWKIAAVDVTHYERIEDFSPSR